MKKYFGIYQTVSVSKQLDQNALINALNKDDEMLVCENREDALAIINARPAKDNDQQYPLYEVEFSGNKGRRATKLELDADTSISAFIITPSKTNEFTVLSASLEHAVADKAEDKVEDKAEDKAEDNKTNTAKKSLSANYVAAASISAGVAVASASFWFSGFYPSTIALLAKAGLALPAAAVSVQVGVSIAVGLMIIGLASAAYYSFNNLIASKAPSDISLNDKNAEDAKNDTRTADQKYHDELKAAEEEIKSAEEKLTADTDKDFLSKLTAILDIDHTAERKFKKDGNPMKKQPAENDKLIVLKYEAAKLAEIAAAEGEARTAKEAQALEAAKTDAAKKFVI